ncbi:major histocompatibility complex class I-related gene protein-like [Rana temporaria]|uniref:major histocompatibility complex class I-related gene protein-like n=1 Tax=Rana temporaria TaxID=8407 RepID=UPI001AAC6D65|nr:major histocompatibility complex class I-related gene protein-like [Rana temporaria]
MGSMLGLSILLEGLLSFSVVCADSHRLNYCFTTIWSPKGSTPPQTQIIGSLDDVPILKYINSERKLQRLADWLGKVNPRNWEYLEEIAKYYEQRHHHTIQRLSPSQNYTDLYVYQVKFGCWIYEDNSTGGEEEFGAHGRDFIFLDNEKREFMASVDEAAALALAKEWNRRPNSVRRQFHYKDMACVQWIWDYLDMKSDDFQKNVRPEVKVWGRRQSDDVTRLYCLVYGFHPRHVDVKWVRNGEDHIPSYEMTPVLPHPDGTYQIRVSVKVPTREGDSYSCHVEHSSLEDVFTVKLDAEHISYTEKRRTFTLILLPIAAVPFLAVFIVHIKKSGRKNKAITEPD